MTNPEPDPFLSRVASFLRTTPEPGWDAVSEQVLQAVRAAPRHGWPLRVSLPSDSAGDGATFVSDHVLRGVLVRELRRRYLCRPTAITFTIDAEQLRAVHLDITGSYGTELRLLGDQIRATVAQVVYDILGDGDHGGAQRPVDVTITDVVTGDPLLSTDD